MPLQTVEWLPSSHLVCSSNCISIPSDCESAVGFGSPYTEKSFVKNQPETGIICAFCGVGLASWGVVGHGGLRYTLTNNVWWSAVYSRCILLGSEAVDYVPYLITDLFCNDGVRNHDKIVKCVLWIWTSDFPITFLFKGIILAYSRQDYMSP